MVHLSLSLLLKTKGKTQLPQLPESAVELMISVGKLLDSVVGMLDSVVELTDSVVRLLESVLPVNVVNCSWIASKASTILAKASSNAPSRDLRDSNSPAEQTMEAAAVSWREMTGMLGLVGNFKASSVSLRAAMKSSEQSETELSDLLVKEF